MFRLFSKVRKKAHQVLENFLKLIQDLSCSEWLQLLHSNQIEINQNRIGDAGKMDVMKSKMAEAKAKQQQKLAQVLHPPLPTSPNIPPVTVFF